MAQQGVLLDQLQFCCSICLDLLKEPVTIPCGHSYCSRCIQGCWDEDEQKGVYSCPQCRERFSQRLALKRNNVLAEVVEKLKTTAVQQASLSSAAQDSVGPGNVVCDFCTGNGQRKAIMSCLVCMASYCETHLQTHYTVPVLKKHNLVRATAQLQEKMCSDHDKLLEVYCRTDQQCICLLCVMDEHKGHDTVLAAAERADQKRQFAVTCQNVRQSVQEREKELKELRQALESINDSYQAAVEDIEMIFTDLIISIGKQCSEVKELIRDQQRMVVSQAEGLLVQLEQEIAELRRKHADLEQLSHTDDNIHFIQTFPSLSSLSVSSDAPSAVIYPRPYFKNVSEAVSILREKLEDILKETGTKISTSVPRVHLLNPSEPSTWEDFLQYSCPLTLDRNTINKHLSLSEGNRKVAGTHQVQPYPDHPDRFTFWGQVLCREALTGRCYWEVKWSGRKVYTAMSYKDTRRTCRGEDSGFGHNDKSWSLVCSNDGYCFRHSNVETKVSGPQSSRVGVYLDHMAGTLSFYSVSDTMTLLHRVQTAFTQPLYAGIWLYYFGDTATLQKL